MEHMLDKDVERVLFSEEELKNRVAEIAACLKLPEGTVKSQLSRGRALLREALKEEIEL